MNTTTASSLHLLTKGSFESAIQFSNDSRFDQLKALPAEGDETAAAELFAVYSWTPDQPEPVEMEEPETLEAIAARFTFDTKTPREVIREGKQYAISGKPYLCEYRNQCRARLVPLFRIPRTITSRLHDTRRTIYTTPPAVNIASNAELIAI